MLRASALGCVVATSAACGAQDDPVPDRGILRQPTGLALSPDGSFLLVTNGNWDRRAPSGTLTMLELAPLDAALASPATKGHDAPCSANADGLISCDAAALIDPERTVVLGDGVGNIAVDRPAGIEGPARLLVPTRAPASLVWLDLVGDNGAARLDCGQDDDGRCDAAHRITVAADNPELAFPGEPSRVVLGDAPGRFAYVPHLLGGALSLIALDGDPGPALADVLGDFFHADVFDGEDFAGGFAVAQRPCDPAQAPADSRDCTRPLLYGSHRYFPGLRQFSVANGVAVLLAGPEVALPSVNAAAVQGRPFMADLAWQDPAGTRLLAVTTTPPALLQIDSRVDAVGALVEQVVGSVPLCDEPNALAVHHAQHSESLALVACRGAAAVAVVGLSSLRVLRVVDVGAGPSEVLIDNARLVAFVANTQDDSVSVVGLDPRRADYLVERARLRSVRD